MSTSSAFCDSLMNTRAGRVHRPERDQPFLTPNVRTNAITRVGQVHQLDALVGVDVECVSAIDAGRRRWPTVIFATGVSRTVTIELLLIGTSNSSLYNANNP